MIKSASYMVGLVLYMASDVQGEPIRESFAQTHSQRIQGIGEATIHEIMEYENEDGAFQISTQMASAL